MRDCPTRDGKQVALDVLKDDAKKKGVCVHPRTRGAKPYEGDDYDGKFLYFFSVMSSF